MQSHVHKKFQYYNFYYTIWYRYKVFYRADVSCQRWYFVLLIYVSNSIENVTFWTILCDHLAFHEHVTFKSDIWDKVFKNEPSKICGRQPLKNLKGYGVLNQTMSQRLSSTNFTWSILEYFVPFLITENWVPCNLNLSMTADGGYRQGMSTIATKEKTKCS